MPAEREPWLTPFKKQASPDDAPTPPPAAAMPAEREPWLTPFKKQASPDDAPTPPPAAAMPAERESWLTPFKKQASPDDAPTPPPAAAMPAEREPWLTPFKKQASPDDAPTPPPAAAMPAEREPWLTPFKKQCWAVGGASVNMAQIGMVMGAASSLLPPVQAVHSPAAASWVASLPGVGLVVGNLVGPVLMTRCGRRRANLASVLVAALGWACVALSSGLPLLLVGRLLQGVSAGVSSGLVPLLIGEYASPRHRGVFSVGMALVMAAGTGLVHTLGSYCSWRTVARVCTAVSLADLAVVLASPESPAWLAQRGRGEEAARAFRWLRGAAEEEELAAMLSAPRPRPPGTGSLRATLREREFYMPVLITMHLYALGQWGGINLLAPYIGPLVEALAGEGANAALVVLSVDLQRVLSGALAVLLVRRLPRRSMLLVTVGANVVALVLLAGYSYWGAAEAVHAGRWGAGVVLLHVLMATVALGSLPLPYTLAGELLPLRHKALGGALGSLFSSLNVFLSVKSFPGLCAHVGLHGALCLHAALVLYSLLVAHSLLPETRDRTLHHIELHFRGTPPPPAPPASTPAAEPLTTFKEDA